MKNNASRWEKLTELAGRAPVDPIPGLSEDAARLMVTRCAAGYEADLAETWRLFCRRALLASALSALICGTLPRPAAQQESRAETALLDQLVKEAMQ